VIAQRQLLFIPVQIEIMTTNTAPAILITIPLSHYCEKARWALGRVALPYKEAPHAPLLHRLATMRNDGGSVPMLGMEVAALSIPPIFKCMPMPSAAAIYCTREMPY
jgi:hypothetical protein